MPDQKPQRMPFVPELGNRDTSDQKDARLVNGFIEILGQDHVNLYKRPGLTEATGGPGTASTGNGVYFWQGDKYAVFGTTLYKNGGSIGTVDAGRYHFSSTLGTPRYLFLSTATKAYYYDGTTLTAVVDVDYPATTVPGSAYLNGVTYVMTPDAAIHGCDTNTPSSWEALNKILAQIEPDGGVALAKQLTYVVALKETSVEVFYDAGNATGSPLSPVQGAKVNYGCRWAESLQDLDGTLIWVGKTRSGPIEVLAMDGLKVQPISNPRVSRLLEAFDGATISSWRAKISGHKFYGITSASTNITLVYDVGQKFWSEWGDSGGGEWSIVAGDFDASGNTLLQHATNGKLATLVPAIATDFGSTFTLDLYTPEYDGETKIIKYLKRMDLVSDIRAGTVSVRFSEDDYTTWSAFRDWDLAQKRPSITDCGSFTRRAWHLRNTDALPLRLKGVEFQIDLGTL